jgi:branched-chain amino acid transport system substrate-binding protein
LVTIGVLTDLSGPYSEIAGQGSIACTRLAAQDFTAAGQPPFDVRVVSADHGNDAKRGADLAAHLYEQESVDLIIDVPNSDVALAVNAVAREKAKPYINCGAGAAQLTGSACSPFTLHWSFDTNMLARSTGGAFTQAGGSTWFFITADYTFGRQLEQATSAYVIAAGGRIDGSAAYPFPSKTDFAPLVSQALQSGATVLGLANAGADAASCVQAAHAVGLAGQMRIAGLLLQLPDVHRLGLNEAGGVLLTESFYWDANMRTRAFTNRLMTREKPPFYPDMIHAGCYAGTLHFLKAVAALGLAHAKLDGGSVVAHMKANPTDDDAFGRIDIRSDGRVMVPAFLFRVKSAAESMNPWDYYELISATSPNQAFQLPVEDSCKMASKSK